MATLVLIKVGKYSTNIYQSPLIKYFHFTISAKCEPAKGDASCCTYSVPCNEGEGDCDADSQCTGDLVCGVDNCQMWNPNALYYFDCCKLA